MADPVAFVIFQGTVFVIEQGQAAIFIAWGKPSHISGVLGAVVFGEFGFISELQRNAPLEVHVA